MTNLNNFTCLGRVVRQPELETKGEKKIPSISFTLAVNHDYKKDDKYEEYTSFLDFELMGQRAVTMQQYLTKGRLVSIESHVKQDRWETSEGKSASRIRFVIDRIDPWIERLPKDKDKSDTEPKQMPPEDYYNNEGFEKEFLY